MSTSPGRPPKIGLRTTAPSRPHGGTGMSSSSVRRQRGGVPPDCPEPPMSGPRGLPSSPWGSRDPEDKLGPAVRRRRARPSFPPCGRGPRSLDAETNAASAWENPRGCFRRGTALTPPLPPKTPGRGKRERAAAAARPGRVGSRRSGRLQGLETCTPVPAATRKQSARK